MTRSSLVPLLALGMTVVVCGEPDFNSHWRDGRAELDGYRLRVSRYGEVRDGTAVMIYVTEPFSESKRTKVEDPQKDPADTFEALKLNFVRRFQTGIYDYHTMLSLFVRTATLEPVKLSLSSTEWCGHVYVDMRFDRGRIRGGAFSYFEDESGPIDLVRPKGGIVEDELFVLLRGLRGHFLAAGEERSVPFLPGLYASRLSHRPLQWDTAVIRRAREIQAIEVPAGSFRAIRYHVEIADGRRGQFHVEEAYPHRILKWSLAPDKSGELTGSSRLPYWQLQRNGDEQHLKELGLPPGVPPALRER